MNLTTRLKKAVPAPIRRRVGRALAFARFGGDMTKAKHAAEFEFWQEEVVAEGGKLWNEHFERFYTTAFGLDRSFYDGASMLDLGCGPAGTLEWAAGATRRIGMDPLVDAYRELGISRHAMTYVAAKSEALPFADGSFDVLTSFNSLDHVDDLHRTTAEIIRVLRPGGTFLLLTEVDHPPTITEPISFSWNVVERFAPALTLEEERRYEMNAGVYKSIDEGVRYDASNPSRRSGILLARMRKG